MKGIRILAILLILFVAKSLSANVTFKVQPPTTVLEGDQFQITFTLTDAKNVESFTPPQIKGCDYMATRPLEINEYKQILKLLTTGFTYTDDKGKHIFRPNNKVKLACILEANLGLRISDVIRLTPNNIKGNKLSIIERKTGKLQYKTINPTIALLIKDYIIENNIKSDESLINISEKAIQKQLRIISKYLQLENVSTHSFRKLFASSQYNNTKNIYLVKELLNHSSIATTQRYIRLSQNEIDKVSENFLLL